MGFRSRKMQNVENWTKHSPMSDLADHARLAAELPSDIGSLNGVIQGLLIHSDWLTAYGLNEADYRGISRATLPAAERLDAILGGDSRDLRTPRAPGQRAVGTCRDFALMLCAFLRNKNIPARVRCGFADYLSAAWEDHWVCEYWDGQARSWRLSDAQMDRVIAANCRIEFDPTDVPRAAFMTAGEAWLACRDRRFDPNDFGHGHVTGAWFIKINVVRDHYAVNGSETSVWDAWRTAANRMIPAHETAFLDDLAARPAQPLVQAAPDFTC